MTIPLEYPALWTDYELIDSGNGAKLERFGSYRVIRPDPRALWKPFLANQTWQDADARFINNSKGEGSWAIANSPPAVWQIAYKNISFILKPTSFKHVGVFPEQATNWDWISAQCAGDPLSVLNLFAYTGGATIAASKAGAKVTHVDSAKSAIAWAKENARASRLANNAVRWIEEDALKFVLREERRNVTYDGIIMDPPRFGRGTKGEVWKLHEKLPKLLEAAARILSPRARFVLINAYTADISALALGRMLFDMVGKNETVIAGELALKESASGRLLPSGLFARWSS